MTEPAQADIDALRRVMTGRVVGPQDSDYDNARVVWNGNIDRRPAVIAQCADASDVSAAITFAREHGLEIAVRGGAHSTGGSSSVDDGLVVDLSGMKQVTVDPLARRAVVGGGATLADLDAATQAHGLSTPGGIVGHTGVAGLTLGGGMGWLTRKAGLAIDNLVAAEVVTADGRIVRASQDENADLFWAIRGGGGNFGVVTTFDFRLHEVGPIVQFGMFFWGLDQGAEALRLSRDVIASPSEDVTAMIVGLNAPPEPFVPEAVRFQPGYALIVIGFGSNEEHEAVVQGIRRTLPPLFDLVTPLPFVQVLRMFDEANAWGVHAYDKGLYVEDLSDEVITVVTEHQARKTSPLSVLFFYRLDGAYSAVGEDDTAFGGGRSPRYQVFIIGLGADDKQLSAERAWVRAFWEALRPHAMGSGGYVNGEAEFDDDRVRNTYGPAKYDRLARIKAVYDPENLFHRNANIRPDQRFTQADDK
jgi:FAD/FMN-containing dehydrogenase